MPYVYILRCEDNSLYTGIARDLKQRLNEHYYQKKTCAKYTKSHIVRSLEIAWETSDLSSAARLEYQIKRLDKKRKEALICDPGLFSSFFGQTLPADDYHPQQDLRLEHFIDIE